MHPLLPVTLIWRGGRLGLLGFALLAPWLLFATELSAVRIQEQFVLYRSYLWMAPAFAGLGVLSGIMETRRAAMALGLIALLLYPLAYDRLQTFSNPLNLWDDAAQLAKGKSGVTGLSRIYMNRAHEFQQLGKYEEAIADYTRALQEKSDFYRPLLLYNRGDSYLQLKRYPEALRDLDQAIALKKDNPLAYMTRGLTLLASKRPEAAKADFRAACELGWEGACKMLNQD